MQPDVKPQLPILRGVAPPQKKRTWCALLTYACILQICSLALLTFIIYVVIYHNGSDSGFPSQAANIVDRLEDCASRINLLAAYILPLANNSSLQNHSHIQQNVFLRARNLPHGTALLMPQSGHLRDVMSDIAFRFGDHEDRLATLRVTGSHDLLFQIKQVGEPYQKINAA